MPEGVMTDHDPKTPKAPQKTHEQVKAERLQAALRDNLRRRKAAANPPPESKQDSGHHEKATPSSD